MAIKQLQNNFTTPDQSKRLLELGVPAWTADCYYYEEGGISKDCTPNIVPFGEVWTDDSTETMFSSYVDIPCWSALRLMEIIDICALEESFDPNTNEYPSTIKIMNKLHISYIEYLVKTIERAVQLDIIDFTKLEN